MTKDRTAAQHIEVMQAVLPQALPNLVTKPIEKRRGGALVILADKHRADFYEGSKVAISHLMAHGATEMEAIDMLQEFKTLDPYTQLPVVISSFNKSSATMSHTYVIVDITQDSLFDTITQN